MAQAYVPATGPVAWSFDLEYDVEQLDVGELFYAPEDPLPPAPAVVNKPYRWRWLKVTAYCPCRLCTPGLGITKTGRNAIGTKGVAVDPRVIPLGTRIDIPGYGEWILADDTGGRIKGDRLDVRMPFHSQAKAWGVKWLCVRIWDR